MLDLCLAPRAAQHPFALSEVEMQPQRVAFGFAQAERMAGFK
jgi:hypothetical protein